jgi:pimeloyl-ACP methyl ester carboxylesterase
VGLSPLQVTVTGAGAPVTLAAHGLGASVAETRPLLSGVPGTRVFPAARGHGGSPLPDEPLDYAVLGRDLEQVADSHAATRALGVSMGAGGLLSLLARAPDRFSEVVLFLPAAIDRPRTDAAVERLALLAAALDAGDLPAVQAQVAEEVPADLRALPAAQAYVATRARFLLTSPGVQRALRDLPAVTPVPDRSVLGAVTARVLVVAQEDDPLHPAQVARELVAVLPRAQLTVFPQAGAVFRERRRLRELVGAFLGG